LAILACVPLSAVIGIVGIAFDKKKWLTITAGGISALLILCYVLWFSYMVLTPWRALSAPHQMTDPSSSYARRA